MEEEDKFDVNKCGIGNFVLVQFLKKGDPQHFIGKIAGHDAGAADF